MSRNLSRREVLKTTVVAGAGFWLSGQAADTSGADKSANEKLNIAVIGIGGRGSANLGGVASQNIVALCRRRRLLTTVSATRGCGSLQGRSSECARPCSECCDRNSRVTVATGD